MNKTFEREIFDSIFQNRFRWETVEFEIPDFLVSQPNGLTLGVEVTEVYSDATDARLKHQEGYLEGLLAGTQRIFRADQGKMTVDNISILRPDGEIDSVAKAVIRSVSSFTEALALVEGAIAEKNAKALSYLENCDIVDLIIHDSSGIFFFKEDEDFCKLFTHKINREILFDNKFREIYFVHRNKHSEALYLPLIINTFMSDILSIQAGYYTHSISSEESSQNEDLVILALYEIGHRQFRFYESGDTLFIHVGAWVVRLTTDGITVQDHTNDLSPPPACWTRYL